MSYIILRYLRGSSQCHIDAQRGSWYSSKSFLHSLLYCATPLHLLTFITLKSCATFSNHLVPALLTFLHSLYTSHLSHYLISLLVGRYFIDLLGKFLNLTPLLPPSLPPFSPFPLIRYRSSTNLYWVLHFGPRRIQVDFFIRVPVRGWDIGCYPGKDK